MQATVKPLFVKKNDREQRATYFFSIIGALLFLAWGISMINNGHETHSRFAVSFLPADTIPKKPKVYSVSYDLNTWARKMDTLNTINGLIGKSLTVDVAEQVRGYLSSVVSGMIMQINQQQAADTIKSKK